MSLKHSGIVMAILVILGLIVWTGCTTPPTPTPTPTPSPLPTPEAGTEVITSTIEFTPQDNPGVVSVYVTVPTAKLDQNIQESNLNDDLQALIAAAALLALVANRLTAALATPIFEKFKLDKMWLMYISWGIGGLLVFLSGINLMSGVPGVNMSPFAGLLVTSIIAGGGSNLIHEIFGSLGE